MHALENNVERWKHYLHAGYKDTMSNLKCIRMLAGEEVMGDVDESSDQVVKIKAPASIHLVPGQSSQQVSIGLLPWLPYSDDEEFTIGRDKIVTIHTPSVDLINNYNRLFGSGIQIAGAGALPR